MYNVRLSIALLCFFFSDHGFSQGLDLNLYDHIHARRNKSIDGVMNGITQSTYPVALALPLGQFIYSVARHDEKSIENAAQSAGGLLIAATITYGIKYSVHRDRPYITHPQYTPYEYGTSPSMPSGHTSFAFATATALSLEYRKWYVVAPSFLYAGAVGYSRIHLGAHYPTDVIVAAAVGAGSSYASYWAVQWFKKKWDRKTSEKFID